MKTIFVDGSYGTAGLYLLEQLSQLQKTVDFNILVLDKEEYKNEALRYDAIKRSDIAILCLPEELALKTIQDLKDVDTIMIDISPAHRTDSQWTYGFSELNNNQINQIKNSKRIANPGCFATGMISLINPLVNILSPNPISISGITGYSAGGKKAIEKQKNNSIAFRMTNLDKIHRHIPEVKHITNLKNILAFTPSVGNFLSGQLVEITLFKENFISIDFNTVKEKIKNHYKNSAIIKVIETTPSYLNPETMANRNDMEIYIYIHEDYMTLISMYDNLGKGSTGSVMQTLEILLK